MLRGQNFRWRHQRHLVAVLEGKDCRLDGHNGLPRPHVALEQAVHRPGRAHVVRDFFQHALLCRGRMEWKDLFDGFAHALRDTELDPR